MRAVAAYGCLGTPAKALWTLGLGGCCWLGLALTRARKGWTHGTPGGGADGHAHRAKGSQGCWRLSAPRKPNHDQRTRPRRTTPRRSKSESADSRQRPGCPWPEHGPAAADDRGPGRPDRSAHRVKASPSQQRPPGPAANVPWRGFPSSRKQQRAPASPNAPGGSAADAVLVPSAMGADAAADRPTAADGCPVNAFRYRPPRLRHTPRHGQRHGQRHS